MEMCSCQSAAAGRDVPVARVTAGSSAAPARRDQGLQQNSKQERGNSPEGIPSGFWGIPSGFWAIPSGKGWELWHSCPGQGWVPIPAGMSVPVLVALGDTGQCDLGRAGGLQGPSGVFQPEPLWGSGTQLEFFIDTKSVIFPPSAAVFQTGVPSALCECSLFIYSH